MGYQRNHHYQRRGTNIVRIEGVTSAADTEFYHGKRIAFVYNAKVAKPCKGHHEGTSKVRVIWGKVTRAHGTSGAVRAQFRVNLPAKAFGATVRVVSVLPIPPPRDRIMHRLQSAHRALFLEFISRQPGACYTPESLTTLFHLSSLVPQMLYPSRV